MMQSMTRATFEKPLSADAMRQMMHAIMAGTCPPEAVKTFLTTLAQRGETAEEIAAAVRALRERAVRLPLVRAYELCDTCGTGGDGKRTINVSTLAGLIAAAAGVWVAKHGNRAASSYCGSADLLEALGINLDASPRKVAQCIEQFGFGFCFAPAFHPAMKVVAPIRRELRSRTIFNLIGPLANPAPLTFQLVGVSEARLRWPMANALLQLGIRHGMVVYGRDGMDEVTTTGETYVLEVQRGRVTETQLDPSTLGVPRAKLEDLQVHDLVESAEVARALLRGEPSAMRDLVVLNAGCAIYVADQAPTISAGIERAHEALETGAALTLLERLRELTAA